MKKLNKNISKKEAKKLERKEFQSVLSIELGDIIKKLGYDSPKTTKTINKVSKLIARKLVTGKKDESVKQGSIAAATIESLEVPKVSDEKKVQISNPPVKARVPRKSSPKAEPSAVQVDSVSEPAAEVTV